MLLLRACKDGAVCKRACIPSNRLWVRYNAYHYNNSALNICIYGGGGAVDGPRLSRAANQGEVTGRAPGRPSETRTRSA